MCKSSELTKLTVDNDDRNDQRIFKAQVTHDSKPVLIKHRFKKKYRHEALDATLTKARVAGEARTLLKCLKCVQPFDGRLLVVLTKT